MAILSIFLTSDILIFETKSTVKEIDDILWRFPSDQPELYESSTQSVNPSTKKLPTSKDKCEPLYVLVYAHCFVWFLFLVSHLYYTMSYINKLLERENLSLIRKYTLVEMFIKYF